MLSVANVRSPSAAASYFAADNYYTGADADRSGTWVGKGAERLGLEGRISAEQFDALLRGELPGGIQVGNAGQAHRPGTDLTFSLPKSWSLLALVGGDQRIIDAYRAAVIETLRWAEKNAAQKGVFEISGNSRYDDLITERYHFPSQYLPQARQLENDWILYRETRVSGGRMEALVFDGVIKDRKIRHDGASHDYSFARKLDDRLQGRDYELSINVITPFHEHSGNAEALRMASMSSDELVILVKADDRFARDLVMYKQTEKYVRQTRATAPQASIERIISEKGQQNANRYRDLSTRARTLIAEAQLYVRGEELDLRGEDPQARVRRAFQTLIDKVYTNLPMLRGATYAETDIGRFLRQTNEGALISGGSNLTEAEQEVLNFAQSNVRTGVRTSVTRTFCH